ncbi:hypothetical protein ACFOGJ_28840 [Marinibaculum pumilum]|uniref:Uncharacterized protein n=1 Tax=Marinibaculum pumilum TaxID=1766165 RepID=A0ABV7L9U7_9PROT
MTAGTRVAAGSILQAPTDQQRNKAMRKTRSGALHRAPRQAAGKPATDAGGKAGQPDKAAAGTANIYETESQTVSDF